MLYNCEIIEKIEQSILSIRTRASVQDLPGVLGKSYGSLAEYLTELGQEPTGVPFVCYYNMDMQDLDIEVGFPVQGFIKGKGDMHPGKIPNGKMASCVHTGPYNKIEPAYNALTDFMREKGVRSTGIAYEFYLNDPQETPEEELETLLLFPLDPDYPEYIY